YDKHIFFNNLRDSSASLAENLCNIKGGPHASVATHPVVHQSGKDCLAVLIAFPSFDRGMLRLEHVS
ncbi:MAG: hypothetical protein WBQ95_18845, partial [Terracidiphilus sp.]